MIILKSRKIKALAVLLLIIILGSFLFFLTFLSLVPKEEEQLLPDEKFLIPPEAEEGLFTT